MKYLIFRAQTVMKSASVSFNTDVDLSVQVIYMYNDKAFELSEAVIFSLLVSPTNFKIF